MSGTSVMGLAVGLAAGVAMGLLAAPMRGSSMRASLRSRADDALARGLSLFEDGRRAFNRSGDATDAAVPAPETLTATLGEMSQFHSAPLSAEAQR
jgi:gas vesicle protein